MYKDVGIHYKRKKQQKTWKHLKCLTKKWFYKLWYIHNEISHGHYFLILYFNSIRKYDTMLSEQNRT